MKQPQQILTEAIETWKPRQIVCLFSGGYDSMCATHLAHRLDTHGIPMATWSIDTKLSADGWIDYVGGVAEELAFNDYHIYSNDKGFAQFCESVRVTGCPRNISGHTYAYQKLKERAIDAMHMIYKKDPSDKTLFISGMRRAESQRRAKSQEYERVGKSNKIFVAPIVYWTDLEVARYRIENDLPDNPFYDTVKGSGDCQCNWGNFLTLGELQMRSPILASGNVAIIDRLSRDNHGYGWDGTSEYQKSLFDDTELDTPFLCTNCSRKDGKHKAAEFVAMQRLA